MTYKNETYGANEIDETDVRPHIRVKPRNRVRTSRPSFPAKKVHLVALALIAAVSTIVLTAKSSDITFEPDLAGSVVEAKLASLDAKQEKKLRRLGDDIRNRMTTLRVRAEAAQAAAAEQAAQDEALAEVARQAATTTLAPPTVTQPPAPPVTEPAPVDIAPTDGSVWDALAQCESGGNWAMNSGNGFYGGLQFMHSTWLSMGGGDHAYYPHEATREQQIEVASRLQAGSGWGQWPACSSRLGLR